MKRSHIQAVLGVACFSLLAIQASAVPVVKSPASSDLTIKHACVHIQPIDEATTTASQPTCRFEIQPIGQASLEVSSAKPLNIEVVTSKGVNPHSVHLKADRHDLTIKTVCVSAPTDQPAALPMCRFTIQPIGHVTPSEGTLTLTAPDTQSQKIKVKVEAAKLK
jgi:hypothetical protein